MGVLMTDRAKMIFGNEISEQDYQKAEASKKKYIRKFGDDAEKDYPVFLRENAVIGPVMGVQDVVIGAPVYADAKSDSPDRAAVPKSRTETVNNESETEQKALQFDREKGIIVGNIRMGFGHYRISMAIASAAHALGYTPYWMDLNSYPDTTCTKVISAQNDLYSMGSRISQKSKAFNKAVWEPLNYEGFRKLSYNASDQKNAELMAPVFRNIPKDIPLVGTHVWPAQAALHGGMKAVVNAIPDNWPMALHLSEGALHTVQTYNAYFGYRTLNGMRGKDILKPMPSDSLLYTGHYIDHELVSNIEKDCAGRVSRAEKGAPKRYLLTIGGAGAQKEIFGAIVQKMLPKLKEKKAALFINIGDYRGVWDDYLSKIPLVNKLSKTYFNDWNGTRKFCEQALEKENLYGIHVFCHENIFEAVYATNLLMRCCDV
ncbi:MAG: hypothetical protein IJ239_09650, partial [Eubacterium sp.]|nr:hypothetical protein [Eubacterium sp.]